MNEKVKLERELQIIESRIELAHEKFMDGDLGFMKVEEEAEPASSTSSNP